MGVSKILIVDDEPYNIDLFSEMLKQSDYIIVSASDGSEAVEVAKSEPIDLILLDWNMPRLDGLETLKYIKKKDSLKDIPVIMITGIMTSPENLKAAMHEGAIDFIRKPFEKIELQARVKSMLLLSKSISELKDKYQVIKNNNKFIHSIFESVPHPMVYYNLEGIIMGYNKDFQDLVNVNEMSLLGTPVYYHLKGGNVSIHAKTDSELIAQKNNLNYEETAGYSEENFIFSKNIFYNFNGEPEGILCVMTNVTEMKKAHDEKLENKKRELASSALRLIQITELNNRIIADLNSISEHTNKNGKDLIRSIVNQFGANSGENIWNEFETRFENVYETFYHHLNQRFTDLTPGERKLCALLRLNLSTKDIAAITFQNPQTIDVARYRLRKKLNLEQDENLVDFLMKIDS